MENIDSNPYISIFLSPTVILSLDGLTGDRADRLDLGSFPENIGFIIFATCRNDEGNVACEQNG